MKKIIILGCIVLLAYGAITLRCTAGKAVVSGTKARSVTAVVKQPAKKPMRLNPLMDGGSQRNDIEAGLVITANEHGYHETCDATGKKEITCKKTDPITDPKDLSGELVKFHVAYAGKACHVQGNASANLTTQP